jgi:hypothetical protein
VKITQFEPFNLGCATNEPLSQKFKSESGIAFFGLGGNM